MVNDSGSSILKVLYRIEQLSTLAYPLIRPKKKKWYKRCYDYSVYSIAKHQIPHTDCITCKNQDLLLCLSDKIQNFLLEKGKFKISFSRNKSTPAAPSRLYRKKNEIKGYQLHDCSCRSVTVGHQKCTFLAKAWNQEFGTRSNVWKHAFIRRNSKMLLYVNDFSFKGSPVSTEKCFFVLRWP